MEGGKYVQSLPAWNASSPTGLTKGIVGVMWSSAKREKGAVSDNGL